MTDKEKEEDLKKWLIKPLQIKNRFFTLQTNIFSIFIIIFVLVGFILLGSVVYKAITI